MPSLGLPLERNVDSFDSGLGSGEEGVQVKGEVLVSSGRVS